MIAPEFHDQHEALCYDYKKATSLEEADLQYAPFDLGGTYLELQTRVPFMSLIISLASNTFVCDNGEAACWMSPKCQTWDACKP